MNSSHVADFLRARGLPGEIVRLPEHTPTVELAARVAGTSVDQIVKSIVFLADGAPLLVVASGLARVDYKRLADHLGLARKRLKLADPPTVLAVTGFEVGTMPPFGHQTPLRTVLDERVLRLPEVFAGGGDLDTLLRIAPADIVRAAQAAVASVVQTAAPESGGQAVVS